MNEIVKDAETATKEVLAETPAEAKVVNVKDEPRRISKIDEKRMRAQQERLRRTMNTHKCDEQAAIKIMQQEDLARLPLATRFENLEKFTVYSVQAMRQRSNELQGNLTNLFQNQGSLAESIEVNFRAFARMIAKLGISLEEQKKFIDEAAAERQAELKKMAEEAEAEKKAEEAKKVAETKKAEEQTANQVLAEAEKPRLVEAPVEPRPIPEGATVFGG